MKTFSKILVAVLILSALLPLNVAFNCLFSQAEGITMIGVSSLSPDSEKIMLMLGGYIISFIAIYALAVGWLLKNNPAGITLSLAIGIINLCRGLLLLATYSSHNINDSMIGIIMIVLGSAITLFSVLAMRERK